MKKENKETRRRPHSVATQWRSVGAGELGGFGFGDASAGAFDDAGEAAGQFANTVGAVKKHGFAGNELLANAESGGPGEKIMSGGLLRDAATGDQGNIGKGAAEGADVIVTANERAGENLDEIGAGFPGVENFGGRECAGHHDNVGILGDHFDGGDVESGTADELGSSVDASLRRLHVRDGAGAEDDAGDAADNFADHIDGARNRHGDFDDGNATVSDFFDCETSICAGGSTDDRDKSDLLDTGAKRWFGHGRQALLKAR